MTDATLNAGAGSQPIAGKVPVFATVGRAYGAAFRQFGTVVRIAWFWALVLLALNWAVLSLLPAWMSDPKAILALDFNSVVLLSVFGLLNGLVFLPPLASIAVNWHRALLLGERPGSFAFVRLDGPVWHYVGFAAVLMIIRFAATLPQTLTTLGQGGAPAGNPFLILLGSVVVVVVFMFLPRLSLALPGAAIGDGDTGMASGFAATRRNTWRLAWGSVLCLLPALALGAFTTFVWPGQAVMLSASPLAIAVRCAFGLVWPFFGVVLVGFMSYVYAHFYGARVAVLRQAQ